MNKEIPPLSILYGKQSVKRLKTFDYTELQHADPFDAFSAMETRRIVKRSLSCNFDEDTED